MVQVYPAETHQLRLVVEIPLFTRLLYIQTVVGLGISEASTEVT